MTRGSGHPPLILGIDPGSQRTGFAVVGRMGRRLFVADSGVITLPGGREQLCRRLGRLQEALEQVLDRTAPAAVAVEDIFTARNARSALALGQARGVVLGVVGRRELPLFAYPPATVKQAVSGYGRADKQQIQRMVQALLSLGRLPGPDEADAMAIAICHAMRTGANGAEVNR